MTDLAERLRAAVDDPTDYDEEPAPLRLWTRQASTIQPKDVEWIWGPWLPAGMLALFAGYGGSGKSTVALYIAAACSIGGTLPDGQSAPVLSTLVFAAEDSPEHTIIPRLKAMGADLSRIHIVDGVARDDDDPGWVQLRNHAPLIEQAVNEHDIGLVIIDPVSSFIGDANSDRESDVRTGIVPLVAVAERTGAAVLMIRHVSKGETSRAASRILGSTAWHDIPRVVWMLADAPDDHQPEPHKDGTRDTKRVLGAVKANLTAKPQARWCLQPVDGPLQWLPDASPVTIDECFAAQSDRGSKGAQADEWLTDQLKGGAQAFDELQHAAAGRFGEKTLRASLQRIGAEKFQLPGKVHGGWYWRLPIGGSEGSDQVRESDPNGQSDSSPLHSSLSPTDQVREVTAKSRENGELPVSGMAKEESVTSSLGHFSLYRESEEVRKSDQVTDFAESLEPAGTEGDSNDWAF